MDNTALDLWAHETRQNPHPVYAAMRARGPVYKDRGPLSGRTMFFFVGYDACSAMLRDQRFAKDWNKLSQGGGSPSDGGSPFQLLDRHMLNMDPPDHTRLRSLVNKAFTPRIVEGLRGRIQQIADELITAIEQDGSGTVDLIEAYAAPLPIIVITELLGIPQEQRFEFRTWSESITHGGADNHIAALNMVQMLGKLFEERRAAPGDDLISALLTAEEEGDRLSPEELYGMIFLLLVAGHETTINLLGNGALTFIRHPEQRALLLEQPGHIGTAVEEVLRFESPVENALARFALEDVTWGGTYIPRGAMVFGSLLAANRDETQFPAPDTFDITRHPNKHLAFGSGIHYCLGAPLARLEGEIGLLTLFRRLPDLRLADPRAPLPWRDSLLFHGMEALPLAY